MKKNYNWLLNWSLINYGLIYKQIILIREILVVNV